MEATDKTAFVTTLTGLATIKNGKLTPEAFELWWLSMQDWSLEAFRMAATHLLKSCQFMPTPKDFEDLRKAGRKTAGEAWTLAKSSWGTGQRNVVTGEYSGSTSGDELVDQAVRMIGGYSLIASSTDEQLTFLERRFCEHYETLEDRTEKRELPQISLSELKRLQSERAT